MILLIILIAIIALGAYLTTTYSYENFGVVLLSVGVVYLCVHLLVWSTRGYEHNMFVQKRNAFELTLQDSRERQNSYETAAIIKEVADWNVELAKRKYNNTVLLFKFYIDDRIDLLQPIH